MNKYFSKIIIPVLYPALFLSLAACSSAEKKSPVQSKTTSGAEDSQTLKVRTYSSVHTLENGLKVYFFKDESLPRVSIQALVRVGAADESLDKAGLNALTAYLLEQGTTTRNALVIADELGALGTGLDVDPGNDFTTLSMDSLSTGSHKMVEIFSNILTAPLFADKEVQRIQKQLQIGIKKRVDDPSKFASHEMDKFLFGPRSRYGLGVTGTEETLGALKKKDIVKHYLNFYRPNNTIIAVVGNFDLLFEDKVKDLFGAWKKKDVVKSSFTVAEANQGLKVKLLIKKGQQQSQIRMSHLGIDRRNPDFLRLRLANETFGGGFAGRLNQKIRDDLGLTYSIGSYFDVRNYPGSFEISTFTKNENAGKVVDEVLTQLNKYLSEGPTDKEVAASKNQLIGQFPRAIETVDRLARNVLILDFYGIPLDYLSTYNQQITAIEKQAATKAMAGVLKADNFKVLVYGDESIIPQFEKYKPEVVHLP